MKTYFVKDLEYDAYFIWAMLKGQDPSGVENRAKSMKIGKELLGSISGIQKYEEIQNILENVVKKRYSDDRKIIDNAIVNYQKAWDGINDIFYSEVERITETKWKFPLYRVVISPFHPGVSNRTRNTVIRSTYEDSKEQMRITAHEILMTHIWNILDNKYPEAKEDKFKHFWAFNEITTVAILGLELNLNKLWTPSKQGYDNYLQNYPQLKKLQGELKEIYLNKKDFLDYLEQVIIKIKSEYQDIDLLNCWTNC